MKLARYTLNGKTSLGLVFGDEIQDIATVLPDFPTSIKEIFEGDEVMLDTLRSTFFADTKGIKLSDVTLEAPIPNPQKYLAIGMNYHDHAEEARAAGIPIPSTQLWFNKQVSCITGPYHPVEKPHVSDMLDYEAELGVVIGKRCRYVSEEDARSVVAGYFVSNDVSARDWQQRSPTFTLGKSFDTHGPIGPWIVTADEIEDPHALAMRLSVNGEPRQECITGGMIYNIWQQIHYLSQVMTLEPGDLIATGTCANVGIALGKFLQPGDVVRVEIDQIGHIENTIVEESNPEGFIS